MAEQQPTDDAEEPQPLQLAIQLADLIHKQVQESEQKNLIQKPAIESPSMIDRLQERLIPGVLEGGTAFVLTLGLLTPVRRVILKAAGRSLGDLPDLIVTVSQAVLAANAGLVTTSLYGSHYYLHQLASVSPHFTSPTADRICHHGIVVEQLLQPPVSLPERSWDPRTAILQEWSKALETCRQRNNRQDNESMDWADKEMEI